MVATLEEVEGIRWNRPARVKAESGCASWAKVVSVGREIQGRPGPEVHVGRLDAL